MPSREIAHQRGSSSAINAQMRTRRGGGGGGIELSCIIVLHFTHCPNLSFFFSFTLHVCQKNNYIYYCSIFYFIIINK